MEYRGNLAYSVEPQPFGTPQRSTSFEPQQNFEVVVGGGLDTQARKGVSEAFLSHIKWIVLAVSFVVALGMVRVSLLALSVSALQNNMKLSSSIEQAQFKNGELKVERSILSSSSRIGRLATQAYGMVLPTETDTIDITQTDVATDAQTPSA